MSSFGLIDTFVALALMAYLVSLIAMSLSSVALVVLTLPSGDARVVVNAILFRRIWSWGRYPYQALNVASSVIVSGCSLWLFGAGLAAFAVAGGAAVVVAVFGFLIIMHYCR